jgi:hypothetical protein
MSFEERQKEHPNLSLLNSQPTSPEDENYNCFAFAANDTSTWWQPTEGYYWVPGIKRELNLNGFIEAFSKMGYISCGLNSDYEEGYEKVAIYCKPSIDEPTHMARQLHTGKWTSKLGGDVDIEHDNLGALENGDYGTVKMILKRSSNG